MATFRLSMTSTSLTHTLFATREASRSFQFAYWIFLGSIFFSLAGTLLLVVFPSLMGVFGPYYQTLVKAPTWTFMALLPVLSLLMYYPQMGWQRLAFFFGWGCFIGGASELLGTTTGFPFGEYLYTFWLGPKLLDHVPYFIPPSWFALAIITHDLASRLTERRLGRILLASLFMVLWDVSLDPAMSRAFPFWTYPEGGFFYGMPLSNWLGWFGVSAVIIAGYEWLGGGPPPQSRWAAPMFLWNCLFPLLLSLFYGLYVAVLVGIIATAAPLIAVARAERTRTGEA